MEPAEATAPTPTHSAFERGAISLLLAMGLGAGGGLIAVVVSVFGIVKLIATQDPTYAIIPLAGGTIGTSAIGTVVWVARKLVNGELVPLPVSTMVEEMRDQRDAAIRMADRTSEREATVIRQGEVREQQLRDALAASTAALAVYKDRLNVSTTPRA